MTSSSLPYSIVCVALLLSAIACEHRTERSPNIVIIVSDDLDYSKLGYNGYKRARTPHIDSIIEGGVYFSNGYVSSPSCAPSRAGLFTGRYQARFGYESQTGSIPRMIEQDIGVNTSEILLPQLLQQAGYTTGVIGKWHLGYNDKYRPNSRGVDYFFGYLTKRRYYWEDETRSPILRNGEQVQGKGYMTEVLAREAAEFIARNRDTPFFLYFAPSNVHVPYVVPDEYIPEGGTVLDGMIQALDDSVGTVLEALRQAGVERETLVIFINDNGGANDNSPFRGVKKTLYEGGIRVPFAMRWPGRLPEQARYDRPVIQLDVLPTVLGAAGATLPDDREYDGVDLLPYLTGDASGAPHDSLFWRLTDMQDRLLRRAVRNGSLKLVVEAPGEDTDGRVELYDLDRDPAERNDLAAIRPDDVEILMRRLEAWEQRMGVRP